MANAVLLVPSRSRGYGYLPDLQDFCATLSTYLQEDVGLWIADDDEWLVAKESIPSARRMEQTDHHGEPIISAERMAAAPFLFRSDGAPDWSSMWKGFCELALYGGPPHRGLEEALRAPQSSSEKVVRDEMVEEIIRGIRETTGLDSAPAAGGWLVMTCDSKRMAAWLCAVIILENVDARCDGTELFVPGDNGFELKDQVKSVITVVAKANHYWQEHIANENGLTPARAGARAILLGQNVAKLRKAG